MHGGLIHVWRTIIIDIIVQVLHRSKKKAFPVGKGFVIVVVSLIYNNALPQFDRFKLLLKELLLLLFKITLLFSVYLKIKLHFLS